MNDLFKFAYHLGFNNPYYFITDNKIEADASFDSIITKKPSVYTINPKALLSFFNKGYLLADDCIVKELNRSPWMAKPDSTNQAWEFYNIPLHQNKIIDEKDVADQLFGLLCEEIALYIGKSKSVGVLLSGGMDSRMLIGCLNHLIQNKKIDVHRVVAYTWGNTNSRDHIYAKRLANSLGWEFKSFQVGAEDMWNNFMISGIRGCEYSGVHLHAMPQITEASDVDVILAGSYGDSVGRAEYSSRKVMDLKSVKEGINNVAGLLDPKLVKTAKESIIKDIEKYHDVFKKLKEYQCNEVDSQLHYLRRKLNACMEVINDKTPLFQIFTSPKVFGYMWSLDVSIRNDKVYYFLLKKFPDSISEVPWARTGKRFLVNEDKPDGYTKKHHNYPEIIQFELYDKILSYVNDNKASLSYINIDAFNTIMKEIKKYPKHNLDFLEIICWVVSFTKFSLTYKDLLEKPKPFSSPSLAMKAKFQYYSTSRARSLKHKLI